VISGASYCSSSDFRVHFGLGAATSVNEVEIRWPDGQVQNVTGVKVDRINDVTEPLPPVKAK
jgi:hypothetical protein